MGRRQEWKDHVFHFGIDIGWTQNVMSRIQDSAFRIVHHTMNIDDTLLSKRLDGKWSIKEHVGHLIDLEQLWINRFKQFEKLLPELIAADMSNQKTENENHNNKSIQTLIETFKEERKKLITTFDELSDEAIHHFSFHPRFKVKMRPIDLLFFIAEHDDHHLTSIVQLKEAFV